MNMAAERISTTLSDYTSYSKQQNPDIGLVSRLSAHSHHETSKNDPKIFNAIPIGIKLKRLSASRNLIP
ncbi:hypothetical protein [Cohnella nanjingensis]|nr:hypothetical protein [Cohnella nanjingensis]